MVNDDLDNKEVYMSEKTDKSRDFSIYYLNLSKVYEMAMSINNIILSSVEHTQSYQSEKEHHLSYGIGLGDSFGFLSGIKASISNERKATTSTSSGVVEKMEVKTTKSVLLRNVIERSTQVSSFSNVSEGDLIKLDNIKLELVDEESAKQILLLRHNALKGLSVEGVEINNLVDSILQDYAYILRGKTSENETFIIKIPTDIQPEFESKYNVNDLMIGHVSIIGIYKGKVAEESIKVNMLNSLQISHHNKTDNIEKSRIISSSVDSEVTTSMPEDNGNVYYIDVLAVVQDVSFHFEPTCEKKIHWWNKIGLWLCSIGRGEK